MPRRQPPPGLRPRRRVAAGDAAKSGVGEHVAVDVLQDHVGAELARSAERDYPPVLHRHRVCVSALVTSTNRSAARLVDAPLAALAGAGAAEEPGAAVEDPDVASSAEAPGVELAPVGLADGETALAPAVALDGEGSGALAPAAAGTSSQPMRLPVTGGRPSTRPVSVAIT